MACVQPNSESNSEPALGDWRHRGRRELREEKNSERQTNAHKKYEYGNTDYRPVLAVEPYRKGPMVDI